MTKLKVTAILFTAYLLMPQITFGQLIPNYTNSWVGNTFGTPSNHIPHSIDNIYVTPSGKVATITGWEEGGHNVVLFASDGTQIGVPQQSGTGSWGRYSGTAVFADDQYIYQVIDQLGCDGNNGNLNHYPVCGTQWFCVRRYNHNGTGAPFAGGKGYDGSFLVVKLDPNDNDATPLKGIIVLNNELYVSDKLTNTIKVYNATTMDSSIVREFSIAQNGLLDYDSQGNIWCLDVTLQKVVRFTPTGTILPSQIIIPTNIKPTAFCLDKLNNRILISNNGADQNIVIYTNIFTTPTQTATFGQTGGINSGIMGEVAPLKLSEPMGVGIDNNGNIYVGNNGVWQGGGRFEKYNSSGILQWRLNGLMFTDNGTVDPTSEIDFYSKEFHLQLNLNNTTPGSEWSLKGMTINRFAFPEDERISNSGSIFWTTTYVRNLFGKRFLYTSDMFGKRLAVSKFNAPLYGETAMPSVYFAHNVGAGKEFIWTDNNNDKLHQTNEYDNNTTSNFYLFHIVPDMSGNVWKTNRENGIRYFPIQGLDTHGNPNYSFATSTMYANPVGIQDVVRLDYDTLTGDLYASGRASTSVPEQWHLAGNTLAKYSNFLNNPTALTIWSITLPYATTNPAADENVKAWCVVGDYIFCILVKYGKIIVREKSTGAIVAEIMPNTSTGTASGWADINGAIQAHKRPNGEYLIFAEENGYGKIMMYRWCPSGNCALLSSSENGTILKSNVYPNPTSGDVNINLNSEETLQLFNIFGQLIYTKQNAFGLKKVDMQNLPNGIYFLKTTQTTYKIIKN